MHVALAAALAAPLDTGESVRAIRLLLVAAISIVFLVISVSAAATHGRKGDTRKSWNVATASIITLIPGVLGFTGLALAFAASVLDWAIPGLR